MNNVISKPWLLMLLMLAGTLFTACGGSSSDDDSGGDGSGSGDSSDSSSSSSSPGDPEPEIGIFIDSPVINVGYRTETQSGDTNSLGEYEYLPGESVIFFIGDLEFPEAPAASVITPLDLANTQDINDPVVVNIIRLLQTLDRDGDPENGIEITDVARTSATQVDFSLSTEDFADSSAVMNLIVNAGQDSPVESLISTEAAIQHFERTLNSNFSIDLTEKVANGHIVFSSCPDAPLGWNYTFTDESMTLTGADSWQTPECTTGSSETFTLTMTELESEFDIPFNCASYPVCTWDDLNKTLEGVDEDLREFTSTFEFDRQTNELTYIKAVEGTTFTEVISIQSRGSSSPPPSELAHDSVMKRLHLINSALQALEVSIQYTVEDLTVVVGDLVPNEQNPSEGGCPAGGVYSIHIEEEISDDLLGIEDTSYHRASMDFNDCTLVYHGDFQEQFNGSIALVLDNDEQHDFDHGLPVLDQGLPAIWGFQQGLDSSNRFSFAGEEISGDESQRFRDRGELYVDVVHNNGEESGSFGLDMKAWTGERLRKDTSITMSGADGANGYAITLDDARRLLTGNLALAVSAERDDEEEGFVDWTCAANGSFDVVVNDALSYSGDDNLPSSGSLQMTTDGAPAAVSFSGQSVTITIDDVTETHDASDFSEEVTGCIDDD
ncbi:hypothetical protein [Marinimicrobium alkaliphilum]|uniref:hypothetical protein n=1 Tax=Marinimicrobium alkaliphilum TaxID=2202654 RepID=UPI000DB948DB|nr:hypothetical protein [Marinimicrobium alkaliphilum]